MAKIALHETNHADFKASVASEKFMYMTRGVAALNPSAGKIISSKEGLWLKTNWCLARLNTSEQSEFGTSQKIWSEESKAAHNVNISRKGAIMILDACVAAQPANDVVTIDSLEHSGQSYLRFAVDGFYSLNRILHADAVMPRAARVQVGPLIKFLKTYLDPMVRLALTPNYLYVIKEHARLGLCLK